MEEFFPVVGFHLPFGVFFHGEFDVDSVSVHAPWEVNLLSQKPLASSDDVDHGVLSDSTDVPRPRWIGWGCVNDKEFFAGIRIESIAATVRLFVGIMRFLNGFF